MNDHASGYDFVKLGEGLTQSLLKAAQEQVTKAQAILDQTQSLADIIMTQVRAQAQQIEDMNVRFKAFGEQMLDAHRKLNGDFPARIEPAPVSPIDRLRALDRLGARNVDKDAGIGAVDPGRAPTHKYGSDDSTRPGGLSRQMADLERFRVNRTDRGEDRDNPVSGPAGG